MKVMTMTADEIDEANKNYPDIEDIHNEILEFATREHANDKTFVGLYMVARTISRLADRVDELTKAIHGKALVE